MSGIVQQVAAAPESLVEFGNSPWRNDFDGWLQGIEGKFEANLVIALACASVGDELTVLLLRDFDLGAGNHRTSERGAEKICEGSIKSQSKQHRKIQGFP